MSHLWLRHLRYQDQYARINHNILRLRGECYWSLESQRVRVCGCVVTCWGSRSQKHVCAYKPSCRDYMKNLVLLWRFLSYGEWYGIVWCSSHSCWCGLTVTMNWQMFPEDCVLKLWGLLFLTASQIIFSSLNFFIISLKYKNFRSYIYFHLFY